MNEIHVIPHGDQWWVVAISGDKRTRIGVFAAKFKAVDYAIEHNPDILHVESSASL